MTSFEFFRSQRKAVANARFIICWNLSVLMLVVVALLLLSIFCIVCSFVFFSHIFFPFFSPFLLTFGSWPLLIHVFLALLR